MLQPKVIISPLPQCLWPPNLSCLWFVMRGFCPSCYSNLWSCSLARSCDKLKPVGLSYPISMATKSGNIVTYYDFLLRIKSNDHIITWFLRSCGKLRTWYLHYPNIHGHKMPGWYLPLPIKSHDNIISLSCKITWQINIIICVKPMLMVINFSMVSIYNEEFSCVKSPDSSIMWSCKVT